MTDRRYATQLERRYKRWCQFCGALLKESSWGMCADENESCLPSRAVPTGIEVEAVGD